MQNFSDILYDKVKEEIPHHIGVYVGENCIKRAKKQRKNALH